MSTRSIMSLAVILETAFWPAQRDAPLLLWIAAITPIQFPDLLTLYNLYSFRERNALGNINSYEGYL